MTIFTSSRRLEWGALDVPMLGLRHDWHGVALEPPAAFALATDAQRLWFIAHHRRPARLHPQSRPGCFQSQLWDYDVAELFIADPVSGRYFEFNLAPNGAWWSCEFTAARVRAEPIDILMPEIATFSDMATDGSWLAALAIPLDLLKARVDFGPRTRVNVAMVLESPAAKYVSAAHMGGQEPDFHQPECFHEIVFTPLVK
ncbi:MAG: hypothetical protein RLZZ282_980 [Verrucomicrobiota bacterium]|jgi:hypothetical protein